MRYVAAYLLAVLGGAKAPSAADIKKILSSVGIEADDVKLNKVVDELKGKSVDELIESGMFFIFSISLMFLFMEESSENDLSDSFKTSYLLLFWTEFL